MEKFTCWNASSVSETVFIDIGALSTSTDAVFLAAHTPARVTHQGPQVEDAGGGEAQVLSALLADVGRHPSNSVIAVTGTPGTGKSHIVRWVYAQLRRPRPELHVLYVPREISNLKELLRSLIKGLPGNVGEEMLSRVDEAIGSATEQEIASRLLGAMAQALRWSFPQPLRSRGKLLRIRNAETSARFFWAPISLTGAGAAAWPTCLIFP